ncbi:MAG: hypothetical protein GXP18_12365 [Gammaproteobacteria bacterium]|nr:hypothetical protein [Gammaproteobacteria bacterium]
MDTKKKELVGNFKNTRGIWRKKEILQKFLIMISEAMVKVLLFHTELTISEKMKVL